MVYTDGSGFLGLIGAAAVNLQDAVSERRYLGSEDQSTVYAAELSGIEMALARAIKNNKVNLTTVDARRSTAREVIILLDSQAAIYETQGLVAIEQSPEDAGYSPPYHTITEKGESLSQLFEYTLPN
ncbi:hypothetical protein N7467_000767 [Penicillium canescens]|nr:hypothetical protein N7467_000767 [Penicillium canescens]